MATQPQKWTTAYQDDYLKERVTPIEIKLVPGEERVGSAEQNQGGRGVVELLPYESHVTASLISRSGLPQLLVAL